MPQTQYDWDAELKAFGGNGQAAPQYDWAAELEQFQRTAAPPVQPSQAQPPIQFVPEPEQVGPKLIPPQQLPADFYTKKREPKAPSQPDDWNELRDDETLAEFEQRTGKPLKIRRQESRPMFEKRDQAIIDSRLGITRPMQYKATPQEEEAAKQALPGKSIPERREWLNRKRFVDATPKLPRDRIEELAKDGEVEAGTVFTDPKDGVTYEVFTTPEKARKARETAQRLRAKQLRANEARIPQPLSPDELKELEAADKLNQEYAAAGMQAIRPMSQEKVGLAANQLADLLLSREELGDSSMPNLKATMLGTGSDVLALWQRVTGRDAEADRTVRLGGAVEQAAREQDAEGTMPAWLKRGARGAGRTLPTMVLGGAAGPYGAIGLAAATEANQAVTSGRDAGLRGSELAGYVATEGVIEALPAIVFQKMGLGGVEAMFGKAGSQAAGRGVMQALKQAGITAAQELPEELITELGHNVNAALAEVDPNATSAASLAQTAMDTTVQTLLTVGAMHLPYVVRGASETGRDQLASLKAKLDSGGTVSRSDAAAWTRATGMELPKSQADRTRVVKEALDSMEAENATPVPPDQAGVDSEGEVGTGGAADSGGNVYQGGPGEVGAVETGTGAEARVAEETEAEGPHVPQQVDLDLAAEAEYINGTRVRWQDAPPAKMPLEAIERLYDREGNVVWQRQADSPADKPAEARVAEETPPSEEIPPQAPVAEETPSPPTETPPAASTTPQGTVESQRAPEAVQPDETAPVATPAPEVGQYVQWTSGGAEQFSEPRRVTGVSEDGSFVFVEGSNTGIPAAETTAFTESQVAEARAAEEDRRLKEKARAEVSSWQRRTKRRGGRLADATFAGLQNEVNAALKLLGLKASGDLTPDGIRNAYRTAAQKAHPDHGGTNADMAAVNRAYDLLSNSPATLDLAKRKWQREHGQKPATPPPAEQPTETQPPVQPEPEPQPAEQAPRAATAPEPTPEPPAPKDTTDTERAAGFTEESIRQRDAIENMVAQGVSDEDVAAILELKAPKTKGLKTSPADVVRNVRKDRGIPDQGTPEFDAWKTARADRLKQKADKAKAEARQRAEERERQREAERAAEKPPAEPEPVREPEAEVAPVPTEPAAEPAPVEAPPVSKAPEAAEPAAPTVEPKAGAKPDAATFINEMVKAGQVRQEDVGKKQFAVTFRNRMPNNRWLAANEISDKLGGKDAGGWVKKSLPAMVDAGLVDRMFRPDGTPVYAWSGATPAEGLVTGDAFEAPAPSQPETQQEAPAEPEQTTSATERLRAGSIVDVPTADINVDPDRFQFKSGITKKGVVEGEELAGDWDPIAAGVILVWEDKDGKLWAVNGHHRTELAQRKNVPTMAARIIREADGITAQKARVMGAELNILEGQGKVEDYAQFFRETSITEEEAEQRGLLARSKGKTGFLVGRFASEDVWTAYRGRKLSAEKSSAIADIGRGNEGLQAAGLAHAKQKSADELRYFLTALKDFGAAPKQRQGDLFGFDDSAIQEAEKVAVAASKIVSALKDRVLAVQGAIKRPEQAKEMGLSGDIASIQKEVDRIREELSRWDKWTTDPELVRRVRSEAGLEQKPAVRPPADEAPGQTQETLFDKSGLPGQMGMFADKAIPDELLPPGERGGESQGTPPSPGQRSRQEFMESVRKVAGTLDEAAKFLRAASNPKRAREARARLAGEIADMVSKAIKAGVTTFAEFLQSIRDTYGAKVAAQMAPMVRDEWEKQRGLVRPDLAIPAEDANARTTVSDVDRMRTLGGKPNRVRDEAVQAEADVRLEADFEGEAEQLVRKGGRGEQLDAVETLIAKAVINRYGTDAVASGDPAKLAEAMRIIEAYRETGTSQASAFRHRRDPVETPEERMRRAVTEALLEPPSRQREERNEARRNGEHDKANEINEKWAKKMAELKAKLRARGIDIDLLNRNGYTHRKGAEVLRAISAAKADRWDKAYEYWLNSILSAPTTQAANIIGNTTNSAWSMTAERFIEAIGNLGARRPEGAQLGEFRYLLAGILPGVSRGARNFLKSWATESPALEMELGRRDVTKVEERQRAIGGKLGRVVRTPTRLLGAVDDFFKSLFAEMEVGARAYRMAKAEGLKGESLQRRVADLTTDMQSEAWDAAYDAALEYAFQEPGGKLTQKVKKNVLSARKDVPGLRYLLPFVTTPLNIFSTGIRKTPLGSIPVGKKMYDNYRNQRPVMEGVTRYAVEQALAWAAVLALLANDDDDPWITGSENVWGTKREVGYRTFPPTSIRIGDEWYNYSRIEPFATAIGLAVDWTNALKSGRADRMAETPINSFVNQMGTKTFLSGIGSLVEAADSQSPAEGFAKWASNFTTSWVPNVARSLSREADDQYMNRRVWGNGSEWIERLGRRTLQKTELTPLQDYPLYDVWGREADRTDSPVGADWLWRILVPAKVQEARIFVADQALMNWNNQHPDSKAVFPTIPTPYYTRGGKRKSMTDEEYAEFLRSSGLMAQEHLSGWKPSSLEDPSEQDIATIKSTVERARDAIRKRMFDSPENVAKHLQAVVYSGTDSPPDKKDYKGRPQAFQKAMDEHKASKWDRETWMKQLVPTYAEAVQLLDDYYERDGGSKNDKSTKKKGDVKPSYKARKKALESLYSGSQ